MENSEKTMEEKSQMKEMSLSQELMAHSELKDMTESSGSMIKYQNKIFQIIYKFNINNKENI